MKIYHIPAAPPLYTNTFLLVGVKPAWPLPSIRLPGRRNICGCWSRRARG